jgi:hypothetical protein
MSGVSKPVGDGATNSLARSGNQKCSHIVSPPPELSIERASPAHDANSKEERDSGQ